ncbi:hypothetical protein [Romboutsia sp.]|uniref:hypothetical protein n=1 Tax=Romboutsia sp. TaxID=1965302 RepID=UPI003F391CAC
MISARVDENEKRVYVDVSGYINSRDAKEFMNNHKQIIKGLRVSQYNLVVNPSVFECERNEDIRDVCMAFFKTGYRRMYLVDPNNYIMSIMSLGPVEKKLFTKSVKVVKTASAIK